MATDARAYVGGNYLLNLGGVICGFLKSVDGGGASTEVVKETVGPTYYVKKHISNLKYDDLVLEVGLMADKALYDWIAASWQRNYQRKNGSVFTCDYNFQAKSEREFRDALVTEMTIPAADAASKEPGYLTLKFSPEETQEKPASGKMNASSTGKGQQQKHWIPANFRLEIDGLDCGKVLKVDSFTVKQTIVTDEIGEHRDYLKEPGRIDFPDLRITLSELGAADWQKWFDDFVVKGNATEDKEKSGRLVFLSPDRQTELLSIKFSNLGIFKLSREKGEANAEQIRRVVAQLYCENMEFVYGKTGATTTPAPQPAPEPEPEPQPPAEPPTPAPAQPGPIFEPVPPLFGRVPGPGPIPETTGRYLVLLDPDAGDAAAAALQNVAGLSVASTADTTFGVLSEDELGQADAVVFDQLGVAVVTVDPDQLRSLAAAADEPSPILAIEPERYVYALDGNGFELQAQGGPVIAHSPDYVAGYRDAVVSLLGTIPVPTMSSSLGVADYAAPAAVAVAVDQGQLTWGLQAIGAPRGCFTGRGVKVAVLDTGLDLNHPDFVGRAIVSQSFVAGEDVQDGHGHGTHTIGTACGPRTPQSLPRYGIAVESDIFVGKVLSNTGRGTDQSILAGINWAMTNGCPIVSMSLGSPAAAGQRYSVVFENAARRAMGAGTLIVAAAGNDSRRDLGIVNPVSHPANCPSIMAVGALDAQLRVAPFSNGGINPNGGEVDIAGPGVEIRSSWPMPAQYRTISGTSMATPHVAGALALFREANPQSMGRDLWALAARAARALSVSPSDVGVGMVQAP